MPEPKTESKPERVEVQADVQTEDVGKPYGPAIRALAEKLPEKDEVQQAYKDGFLADSAQDEAKAKVKVVDASPDADETPSGSALKKSAGVSNDAERGEKYLAHKTAARWGYVPVE